MGEPYTVWLARLFAELRTRRPVSMVAREFQIKTRTAEFWARWVDRIDQGLAVPPVALAGPLWEDGQ